MLPKLLYQFGLVSEIAWCLVLAAPGLSMPTLRKGLMGWALRMPHTVAWLLAFLAAILAAVASPSLLFYGRPPVLIWLVNMVAAMFLGPMLIQSVLPGVAEAGRRPTDEEKDRVQLTGITLLVIGFGAQGLASALA